MSGKNVARITAALEGAAFRRSQTADRRQTAEQDRQATGTPLASPHRLHGPRQNHVRLRAHGPG